MHLFFIVLETIARIMPYRLAVLANAFVGHPSSDGCQSSINVVVGGHAKVELGKTVLFVGDTYWWTWGGRLNLNDGNG